jgi:hypothetical protein
MLDAGFTEHSLRVRAGLHTSTTLPPSKRQPFERYESIIPADWQPGKPVE